jgi:uncharacterized protein
MGLGAHPRIAPPAPPRGQTDQAEAFGMATARQPFHVLAKPTGAICNLDCKYCYFLSKERLYPNSKFRMSDELLEAFLRQQFEGQGGPVITVAWQGGEPTLMGVEFFRRSIELERKYAAARPGIRVENTLQTNGTVLDDTFCAFLREHDFLVGLSIDGPAPLHDANRVDKGGKPTFEAVMRGARLLQKHGVRVNALCTVNAANARHPLDVYRFLKEEVSPYLQFIPIVERANDTGFNEGTTVTARSVTAEDFGAFLVAIFDEWVRHDVGEVFVQMFDVTLQSYAGMRPGLCIFEPTCGNGVALEHNGDLYSCDHYVEPGYLLGNVHETPLVQLVRSDRQLKFGRDKLESLTAQCRRCEVRFACNGGCPKDRFVRSRDGEPNQNYLCAGYERFFKHVARPMRMMAALLREGRAASDVMALLAREELTAALASAGRNDPCPCGSGRKYKRCHGGPGEPARS